MSQWTGHGTVPTARWWSAVPALGHTISVRVAFRQTRRPSTPLDRGVATYDGGSCRSLRVDHVPPCRPAGSRRGSAVRRAPQRARGSAQCRHDGSQSGHYLVTGTHSGNNRSRLPSQTLSDFVSAGCGFGLHRPPRNQRRSLSAGPHSASDFTSRSISRRISAPNGPTNNASDTNLGRPSGYPTPGRSGVHHHPGPSASAIIDAHVRISLQSRKSPSSPRNIVRAAR